MLVLGEAIVDKAQREKETVYQLLHCASSHSICFFLIDVIMKETEVFHLHVGSHLKTFTIKFWHNIFCKKSVDEKISNCPMETNSDMLLNAKVNVKLFLSLEISQVFAIKLTFWNLTKTIKCSFNGYCPYSPFLSISVILTMVILYMNVAEKHSNNFINMHYK